MDTANEAYQVPNYKKNHQKSQEISGNFAHKFNFLENDINMI
jgi:hypothetical protein